MALRDFESFDNINSVTGTPSGAFPAKGWGYGGNSPRIRVGGGRFGTDCFYEADNSVYFSKLYDSQSTWIIGFAAYFENLAGSQPLLGIYDGVGGAYQVSLYYIASIGGKFAVYRGPGTTLLGSSTLQPLNGVWYYMELKVVIHDTTGSIELRVNESTEISLTNIDTQTSANATADRFYFGSFNGGNSHFNYDDLYILDGTGSAPFNDFLGDCRVSSLLPNGNGNSSQFDGSDGNQVDNYLLVDEPGPASGTDYVQSPDVNDKDTYAFADLPSTAGTVHAVKPVLVVTKDDAGNRMIRSVARLSATETESADHALSSSYEWVQDIRTTKPGGGSWTVSDVNSAEFGIKVSV